MNIIIFAPTSTVMTPDSIKNRPLGGADKTFLKMCKFLGEKHQVYVYGSFLANYTSEDMNVKYFPYMDLFLGKHDCDLFIHFRKFAPIPNTIKYKKAIFYSQDLAETPCFNGVMKTEDFEFYEKVIVLSEFHKENLKSAFDIPEDKFIILGNAAKKFQRSECVKKPYNFIYCSTPYRGLHVLTRMWKRIKEKYPKAILHVFSSMSIYGASSLDDYNFNDLYEELKLMDGVIYYGSKTERKMLEVMKYCEILLYPNTYPETYCNVIMEARGCFTPFITTDRGALRETGGVAGYLIDDDPLSFEYQKKFLLCIEDIRKNYGLFQDGCQPVRTWHDYQKDILKIVEDLK